MTKIFLAGGRTGGPLMPLIPLVEEIEKTKSDVEIFLADVGNGFGAELSKQKNWNFVSMPEAKLSILTFKSSKALEILKNFGLSLWQILLFLCSLVKGFYLNFKHKPDLIISAGGFTAVPLILSNKLTNLFKITKSKIVVHQQDPLPGLSNKMCASSADILSCVFEYTKESFKKFQKARIIPNIIDESRFETDNLYIKIKNLEKTNSKLFNFFKNLSSDKKLLLIYGGYSGADFINKWIIKNLDELKMDFNIIHLTGLLQKESLSVENDKNYFRSESLNFENEIPVVLASCDLVISRAGLGSITELLYLKKPAFLVPIPDSHQELNAKLTEQYFYRLKQTDEKNWLKIIKNNYPLYFKNVKYPDKKEEQAKIKKYYKEVLNLLD